MVARLDPKGKLKWEVSLPRQGFLDYTGTRVAAAGDGCIALVFSFVHPGRWPVVRLVRLDGKGQKVWDTKFRGDGGYNSPVPDRVDLLPDGSVLISGRIYPAMNVEKPWKGKVNTNGKIVMDQTGN